MKTFPARYLWVLLAMAGGAVAATSYGPAASAAVAGAPQPERSSHGFNQTVGTGVTTTVYLPIVVVGPNLAIDDLEVTQSVQRPDNSVPLVANRRTMLRVYASSLTGAPLSNVNVSVAATQNGVALPGSPLVIGPQNAPVSPSRANYGSSFNVELLDNWLSGAVVITATAYQGSTPYRSSKNIASVALTFTTVPTLDVTVVPIQYTDEPSGVTYSAPPANNNTASEISDWIMRAYPVSNVNISFHAAYSFSGDLSNSADWYNLLNYVTSLKQNETGYNGTVYYGLIPTTGGGNQWFRGGTSGMGQVGWIRASIGLELPTWPADTTGQNAAHEIGHNLDRSHAPCGNPGDPDPNYPYAGGIIGQFGLDIPKGVLWNPATTYDLMSYCQPQWVSDYTYQGLYNNQRSAYGLSILSAAAPGLYIRGDITDNQVTLKPIYALNIPLSTLPPTSNYQAELLDARGQVVATYLVPVVEADLDPGGGVFRAINAVVPQPAQPVARARLMRAGRSIAEKALYGAGVGVQSAPTVSRTPGGPITLNWSPAVMPALVRYSADGGQTWTMLGVDALGGTLTLDPATLPANGAGQFEVTLAEP